MFFALQKEKTGYGYYFKKSINFIAWTIIIGLTPPAFGSIIRPFVFHECRFNCVGGVTHVFWISLIAYSIMKHSQMNVRVALAEILILTCTLLLFVNIFV